MLSERGGGPRGIGGVAGYPIERLYEEVAYLAYHFHWDPQVLLNLDHAERRRWVSEVAAINRRMNQPEQEG